MRSNVGVDSGHMSIQNGGGGFLAKTESFVAVISILYMIHFLKFFFEQYDLQLVVDLAQLDEREKGYRR